MSKKIYFTNCTTCKKTIFEGKPCFSHCHVINGTLIFCSKKCLFQFIKEDFEVHQLKKYDCMYFCEDDAE